MVGVRCFLLLLLCLVDTRNVIEAARESVLCRDMFGVRGDCTRSSLAKVDGATGHTMLGASELGKWSL